MEDCRNQLIEDYNCFLRHMNMNFLKRNTSFATRLGLLTLMAVAPACAKSVDEESREPIDLVLDERVIEREGLVPRSFAPMIGEAKQAVVSVTTARVVRVFNNQGPSSREEELLRRFFGMPTPRQEPRNEEDVQERRVPQGVGSGVIVREDGYVLTNNHVISGQNGDEADEVLVTLNDGRELPARVLGRDPKTDIAVLKIEAEGLPTLSLADSDNIEVGDIVFAVGNPMGVGQTVTQGIVSAKGREIGIYGRDGYENFIQTDASINPGNSGGALVDIDGRLIGINSAILSQSGGNIGIGFAIPANLAVAITGQLTAFGEVKRGFLGVQIADLDPDMAEAFGLDSTNGALIESVEEETAAERAGLEIGDVIVELDGRPVRNANQLKIRIAQLRPDSEIEITYVREGERNVAIVAIGDKDATMLAGGILEGVSVQTVDEELRGRYGYPSDLTGLLITELDPASPFARRLREGMVIIEVNGVSVQSAEDAQKAFGKGVNRLYVYDRGRVGFLALRID